MQNKTTMQPRLQMLFIIYDLDNLPKNPSNNFKIKSCLFGATNIAKSSNESKHGQSSYRITLDGADSWSFGNEFIKNVIIFGVDNSSSSHKDNHQNGFLVLGEGPAEQNLSIYFSKPKTKFCLSLDYNHDNGCLFVNRRIYRFKANNKNINFPTQTCLGGMSNKSN